MATVLLRGGIGVAIGLIGIVGYALQAENTASFASVVSVGAMTGGACLVFGGLLGFLFGIPRTFQHDRTSAQPTGGSNQTKPSQGNGHETDYQANTNLEQISDFLTKILVGVGLTQLASIPANLQALSVFLAPGLGNFKSSTMFALALFLYFLVTGFLIGYLWTRLGLAGALRRADTVEERMDNLESKQDDQATMLARQIKTDADTLALVNNQLDPSPHILPVPPDDLNTAIKGASGPVQTQIFFLARKARQVAEAEKAKEETEVNQDQIVNVFKALILGDKDNEYHRNHGELGYALMDKIPLPKWADAVKELSTAIEIRDRKKVVGFGLYEYSRAVCRINLDTEFNKVPPERSSPDVKKGIEDDLRTAIKRDKQIKDFLSKAAEAKLETLIGDVKSCKAWMDLNLPGITIDNLAKDSL